MQLALLCTYALDSTCSFRVFVISCVIAATRRNLTGKFTVLNDLDLDDIQ